MSKSLATHTWLRNSVLSAVLFLNGLFIVHAQQSPADEHHAQNLLQLISTENRFEESINENNITNMPLGVKRTYSNIEYVIAFDTVELGSSGAFLNAYSSIKFPSTNEKLMFGARDILYTPGGLSASIGTRLELMSSHRFKLNDQVTVILPNDGTNYIEWDCNGFKSVNLKGVFEFNSSTFIPAEGASNATVQAAFEINTTDLNNIVISVSISPFRLKELPDFTFNVNSATLDFSDFANPAGFTFPAGYSEFASEPNLWRGFFLKNVTIQLPSELSSSGQPAQISAQNMVIDDYGFSGAVTAQNLLTLGQGDASGWPFSVTTFGLQFSKNSFSGGQFGGVIAIPFFKGDTLQYSASIQKGNQGLDYAFIATTTGNRTYNLPLSGSLKLSQGCRFEVKKQEGKFVPSLFLNGAISLKDQGFEAGGLAFEGLHLTAEDPYILGGTFSHTASMGYNLGGFSISVSDILLGVSNGKAKLSVTAAVDIMGESQGISAEAGIEFTAETKTVDNKQKWEYTGCQINEISIDAEFSAFVLSGTLQWYRNDPVYGNGFKGDIYLYVDAVINAELSAKGLFGTKDGLKYWYAKVDVPVYIPIGTGVFLWEISGGVYRHLRKNWISSDEFEYVPDKDTGFGFIAGVGLAGGSKQAFCAAVEFELAFNNNWGLKFAEFNGAGSFFSGKPDEGYISATMNSRYDCENRIFHAKLGVSIDVFGVLKGTGPGGLVGEAIIHTDPNDWYVYIGRPTSPVGVSVLGLITANTYFMVGTQLENLPLPPSQVRAIIGTIDRSNSSSLDQISKGGGFAFGLNFDVNVGIGQNRGFVYAFLNVGGGTDILLKNFGDAKCMGQSGQIGISGWYAQGQAYVYLQGKLGIRAKGREFDIMSVAAAALLEAKAPNPSWFKGTIVARYKILGGLIRGKVSTEFEIGEQCQIQTNGNELGGISLIGDITPADKSTDVNVFSVPQVAFNTAINQAFVMENLQNESNTYRVVLDDFSVQGSKSGKQVGVLQFNSDADVAIIKLHSILPGLETFTATAKVHIEKKTNTGTWQALTNASGAVDYETKTITFNTAAEPTTIDKGNIEFCYPLDGQFNVYRSEYKHAYIQLKQSQDNLFKTEVDGKSWELKARFKSGSNVYESKLTYDFGKKWVQFDIPQNLALASVYQVTLIRKPLQTGGGIDRNLKRGETVHQATKTDSLSVTNNKLDGAISGEGEKEIHQLTIRTSKYATFVEKLNSHATPQVKYAMSARTKSSLLGLDINLDEAFDVFEISGANANEKNLVFAEGIMQNSWLGNYANPLLYNNYASYASGVRVDRDTSILGLRPMRNTIFLYDGTYDGFNLSEKDRFMNTIATKPGQFMIRYWIPDYICQDYFDLLNGITKTYTGGSQSIPDFLKPIIERNMDDIYQDHYRFKLYYRLPGINRITSSKEYSIDYFIR